MPAGSRRSMYSMGTTDMKPKNTTPKAARPRVRCWPPDPPTTDAVRFSLVTLGPRTFTVDVKVAAVADDGDSGEEGAEDGLLLLAASEMKSCCETSWCNGVAGTAKPTPSRSIRTGAAIRETLGDRLQGSDERRSRPLCMSPSSLARAARVPSSVPGQYVSVME